VLIPGLVNLHTHAAMSLLRGLADDLPLMQWLQEHVWPAEAQHASAQFVHDGTLLACAEMLRGGITCFNDMYFFPESCCRGGARCGNARRDRPHHRRLSEQLCGDADDYLAKGLAVRDQLLGEPLLSFCLAPHAPYTVGERSFARVLTLAEQIELPIHLHLHETVQEIDDSLQRFGMRPIERLRRLGLLSPA
jgi:5-methylthioadenosine/S-adenosylhomocysteine deaminase